MIKMTFRSIDAILSCNLTVLSAFRRLQCKVQRGKMSRYHFFLSLFLQPVASRLLGGIRPHAGGQNPPPSFNLQNLPSPPRPSEALTRDLAEMSSVFYVMHALSINHGWIRA